MNADNKLSVVNASKNSSKTSCYSIASFILAVAPIAILLIGFLFCLIVSTSCYDAGGAVWWLLIALMLKLPPVIIITSILSVILGVIGLKKGKKTVFAWAGIIIVFFEFFLI